MREVKISLQGYNMHTRRIFFLLLFQLIPLGVIAQNLNDELIAAARKSNVDAVKALLAKGADVNAKTEYGATPLFFACDRGNAEIVKILLEHGADANVKDRFYNSTPITWALQRDHAEVVKLLIGKTPMTREALMTMAVGQGEVKVSKMLLETGTFKPDALTTYLAMAEKNGKTEIVDALKKAGAAPKTKTEFKVDTETLKNYEGAYKNDQIELTFKVKDGKLTGGPAGQELTLIPVEKHTFEVEGAPGITAEFKIETDKVTGLLIKQPGGQTMVKKVEVK